MPSVPPPASARVSPPDPEPGAERTLSRASVLEARGRVYRFAVRTPLRRSAFLSEALDAEVFAKLENEQPVGSFKIRGATNLLVRTEEPEIVASSSGNHGIAVAYVAARLGRRATIVLPEDANPQKRAAIERLGAETILRGRSSDERNAFARRYAEERGARLVPPFDDPRIVAGQGTAGLEIQEAGAPADIVLVPVGGGGLLAGIALSYPSSASPVFYGVQPEGAASMRASLEAGRPVTVDARSVADGISVSRPAELTFDVVRQRVREVLTVSDAEILDATRTLWREAGFPVEPASASTFAAARRYRDRWHGRTGRPTIVLLFSGGNVSDAVRRLATGTSG